MFKVDKTAIISSKMLESLKHKTHAWKKYLDTYAIMLPIVAKTVAIHQFVVFLDKKYKALACM